jgi:hypothetical protein
MDVFPGVGPALRHREGVNSISLFSNTLADQQWVSSFRVLIAESIFRAPSFKLYLPRMPQDWQRGDLYNCVHCWLFSWGRSSLNG